MSLAGGAGVGSAIALRSQGARISQGRAAAGHPPPKRHVAFKAKAAARMSPATANALAGVLRAAQRVRRIWKKRPVTVFARFTAHRIEPNGDIANGLLSPIDASPPRRYRVAR